MLGPWSEVLSRIKEEKPQAQTHLPILQSCTHVITVKGIVKTGHLPKQGWQICWPSTFSAVTHTHVRVCVDVLQSLTYIA